MKKRPPAEFLSCPVDGCLNGRKPGHLMCFRCWRRVPMILRRAVWDTFDWYTRMSERAAARVRAGEGTCTSIGDLSAARREYDKAAAGAIAAVVAKKEGADAQAAS